MFAGHVVDVLVAKMSYLRSLGQVPVVLSRTNQSRVDLVTNVPIDGDPVVDDVPSFGHGKLESET